MATAADTILAQIGGRRALALMIGAGNFFHTNEGNTLQFHWKARSSNRANCIQVTLTPADTYRVEFYRTAKRGLQCDKIGTHEDIYADSLRELFERETGLVLTVPRIIGL